VLRWGVIGTAAERGKHVLCEKLLALTEAECRAMRQAAESNGVRLMEACIGSIPGRSWWWPWLGRAR
jgi:predicted dehydrogenase